MGRYTVIANVSEEMVHILQKELVPELISDESTIGLCSPEDPEDMELGIFLYDIQENDEVRRRGMINDGPKRQQYPPAFLSLYYMLTAYSQSDRKFRMAQEQRILGRVVRKFHDYPYLEVGEEQYPLQLMKLSTEDKLKLWNFNGKPYKPSLFYKAAPVILDSARYREVTRVQGTDFGVSRL